MTEATVTALQPGHTSSPRGESTNQPGSAAGVIREANSPKAALERLAAALDSRDYATTLLTSHGQTPRLTVVSRLTTALAEDIYAGNGWYWWSWAEKLAPIADVPAAARKIATVLRTIPEPTQR